MNKSFAYHLRLPYVLLFVYDEENQNRTIIISWFSFRFVIMTILAVLCWVECGQIEHDYSLAMVRNKDHAGDYI